MWLTCGQTWVFTLFQTKAKTSETDKVSKVLLVGITGFEPAASSSRTKRATKLRYIPKALTFQLLNSKYYITQDMWCQYLKAKA